MARGCGDEADGEKVMPIYDVTIKAPAIYEEVVVNAENAVQARERAIYSALQRQADAAEVTVQEQG